MPTDLPSHILDAIPAAFQDSGDPLEKAHDDLRYELEFQNDCAFEDNPEAEEVTLLQLLHASTAKLKAGPQDPAHTHIHELIEHAFIEQEALGDVQALWPETNIPTFASIHVPLLEAAVRDHLSAYGLTVLDAALEQARESGTPIPPPPPERLPDYRDSPFLHFSHDIHLPGDPETEPAFTRTRRLLESITAHFLETGLWEKTPTDLLHALEEHNTRHRPKTGQEHQTDIPETAHQGITLANLQALSKRRILAMEDTGWHLTHLYRIALTFDRLIEKALTADYSLNHLMQQTAEPPTPSRRS